MTSLPVALWPGKMLLSHTPKKMQMYIEVKGGKRDTFKKMTRKRYNLQMEKENHSKDDMIL